MKEFKAASRLNRIAPYLFAEIDRKKNALRKKGVNLIDLSIGDPDIPAPEKVVNTLYRSAKIKDNQKYALDQGKDSLRESIQKWFKKRFSVVLDKDGEILPLIGSKEGLVHLGLSFLDSGQYVIVPSPGYPGYRGAAYFSGARIHELPLLAKKHFLPDFSKIPLVVRNKAKIIYLNYPHNPTTALAPESFLKELVKFCLKYGIIIAYDNAYSEIYFDKKPKSILQIKGAKEIAIEFHSFSKTFCLTGFRIGWACGNRSLIKGLLKVKINTDSGVFGAIQDAASYALDKEAAYVRELRGIIKGRKDLFVRGLEVKGFKDVYSESTFYVWARIPSDVKSSVDFAKVLLAKGIVVTPGVGFGKYGEGFIRFALTVNKEKLNQALSLL